MVTISHNWFQVRPGRSKIKITSKNRNIELVTTVHKPQLVDGQADYAAAADQAVQVAFGPFVDALPLFLSGHPLPFIQNGLAM